MESVFTELILLMETYALKTKSSSNAGLRWETEMVKVKKLEAGDTVSYGATYTADGAAMGSDISSWLCRWIYSCLQ